MGKPPVRDVKSNIRRGGKHPADLEVERADAKVNSSEPAVDESAQEAPKPAKPKRGKIAELTKQLEEAAKRAEEAEKRAKEADKKTEEANKKIKELETLRDEYSKSFFKRNQELAAAEKRNIQLEVDRNVTADNLRTSQNRIKELEDSNNVYINGAKSLVNRQKALREDYENIKKDKERLSKVNQDYRTQNSILTESIRQSALKSDKEVTQAQKELESTLEPKAEEIKTDNSGTTEEPVTPEGEAKVEGEPQAKTEQAQTTQESAKETNGRPGTGEVTKDNIISPEDAFKFFNNKENYDKASTVFKTPSFDEYIDATTGKWIPRSYFDAFNAKDGIDPKKFTFEHFKAKIPEDPGKQLTAEEKTADLYNKNKAEEDYEKEYKNFNTGFKAYLRRHPKLEKILKTGKIAGSVGILYGIGQMFNDAYTAGQNDNDELKNIIDGLNDDDPEPWVSNVNNNSTEDITKKLKDANESTETPEGDSGTIEQAVAEQAPAGNVEPENPQVASNEATPTNTKANNAPASTAESAPTQGLPPVVTRDAPPANPDSSGMTYSQRVESGGKAPQAGSMAYNANNPDMVTAGLIDAMNQNSQAGSDAIGYGDLYDQNFIDFWAKRNPNLAFGVSQGRR